MIRASVAMITYNGENYIREQIASVLAGMGEQDELVISDDGSTDHTVQILEEYAMKDARIRLTTGPGRGVKANVDHVLRECHGKFIFLADQDDIWKPEKMECVLQTFVKTGCSVVVHDATVVAGDGSTVLRDSFYTFKNSGAGVLKNIWRNTYVGCCMAFRQELLEDVLPIPDTIEMHDQWIGVINDRLKGGTCFLPDKLLFYRRHGENSSQMTHYGIKKMLHNRLTFIRELHARIHEIQKNRSC